MLVFTHTFIPPHPPFVSLHSSSLLPNWKKKSAPNFFLSVAKLFEMLVLLMEIFRVKFKYQKTFNGRQGIQQMTETVFSLHVIPLFAGSYISCPSSTLSLMKIRAKNKFFFFFKGNLTVFWHGCRDALFAHAHPQLSCLSSPLSHSICSRSLVLFVACVFSFVVIAILTVTTFFLF